MGGGREVRVEQPRHRQVPIEGYPSEVRWSDQHWEVVEADIQDKSSTNVQPLLCKSSLALRRLNQATWT